MSRAISTNHLQIGFGDGLSKFEKLPDSYDFIKSTAYRILLLLLRSPDDRVYFVVAGKSVDLSTSENFSLMII